MTTKNNNKQQDQSPGDDFLNYDWDTVDQEHAETGGDSVGPTIQWLNGKDGPYSDAIKFGGFEIPVQGLEAHAHTLPDWPIHNVPHGSGESPAYLMPSLSLCVVGDMFLYESKAGGDSGKLYTRRKGTPGYEGRLWLYAYVQEFAPFVDAGTPFIVSLKGSAMAQYFAAKKQFTTQVINVGAELIRAVKGEKIAPKLPLYMFWMPLTTSGREWRKNAANEDYGVAPIIPAWDEEIADSTLEAINPGLSQLRIDGNLHQLINVAGYQAYTDWKAESEARLLEADTPMSQAAAIGGMNNQGAMTKDQLTDRGIFAE